MFMVFAEANKLNIHYKVYEAARIAQVQSDLKANIRSNGADWDALVSEVPYRRGNHPLGDLCQLAVQMLRGERQLCAKALSGTHDSLGAFAAICSAVVEEIRQALDPLFVEAKKPQGGSSNKQVLDPITATMTSPVKSSSKAISQFFDRGIYFLHGWKLLKFLSVTTSS